jgi:hypothetical protein
MSNLKPLFPAIIFLAGLLSAPAPASPQDYVVMGTPLVNLRTGPSTSAMVIGRAQKGDIFRVVGETEGWYEVLLFSGEPRFVVKADFVYPLLQDSLVEGHDMILPTSTARARSIFWDTESGLDRAAREASEVIPVHFNRERHTVLKKIFEDRILLEMFHIHGLQPALYGELVATARREGWG